MLGRAVADTGQIDDHGDVLVAATGMAPDVFVGPDHPHAVEPAGIIDQHALALGKDRVVGGVPCDPEALGDTGDGQVLNDDPFQRSPQPTPGQLRPRLGRRAGVLAPHVTTPRAPVTAHGHLQSRRTPAQWLMRQPPDHRVARHAFTATTPAPAVRLDNPARQHRTSGLEPLSHDFEAELVHASECGQVRASEGNVRHVEVFPMGSMRTPIIGRPRPLPGHRRAHPPYT